VLLVFPLAYHIVNISMFQDLWQKVDI